MPTEAQSSNKAAQGARGLAIVATEKAIMKVTAQELAQKIIESATSGFRFAQLDVVSDVKMNKKHRDTKEPNPYGRVTRSYSANVGLGWSYENAMRKEWGEEWQAQPRKWGERRGDTPIVDHKGSVYATVRMNGARGVMHHEGEEIEREEIAGYLPPQKESTESASDNYREINLANVVRAKIDGITYQVEG